MKKIKLNPNTLESLIWGLMNFDGIETDIRFNKEEEIVVYHDTKHKWRPINKINNEECRKNKIVLLKDFLVHPEVQKAKREGKHFIFELKPDCDWYRECTNIARFRDKLFQTFNEAEFEITTKIHFMSFSKNMLSAFKDDKINLCPIFPLTNFCVYNNRWSYLLWKPIYFIFKHTTTEVLQYAKDNGYTGAYLSFPYFYVMNKIYKETRKEIMGFAKDNNLQIMANFYLSKYERKYDNMIILTDRTKTYPRHSTSGGAIIGHKGCGTNSVKIPINEYEDLMKLVKINGVTRIKN